MQNLNLEIIESKKIDKSHAKIATDIILFVVDNANFEIFAANTGFPRFG